MLALRHERKSYIPKGATLQDACGTDAAIYFYELAGRSYSIGFHGRAQKPTFHHSFRSLEARSRHAAAFIEGRRQRAAARAEHHAKRKAFRHTLKVGDVLRCSWGYDQTNVDYYQVLALKGATQVVARSIHSHSQVTGWEQGKCGPDVGNFKEREPAKVYRVQEGNGIRVHSFASAWPVRFEQVGNLKVYESSHWTSYA